MASALPQGTKGITNFVNFAFQCGCDEAEIPTVLNFTSGLLGPAAIV